MMPSLKNLIFFALLSLVPLSASAQQEWLNLAIEARVDYQRAYIDKEQLHEDSGFKGRNFNLILKGELGSGFGYAYRQRLNRAHKDERFFDATDWIYLTYTTRNDRWSFLAGKQVLHVGGYEYDLSPIDGYFSSEYCTNFPCYQFGVSVTHALKGGRDHISFQVTESPFRTKEELYAYNLYWSGAYKWFELLYSINAIEWTAGEYIYYIALGNRFKFPGVTVELDLTNRATKDQPFWFSNYTLMGQLRVDLGRYVKLLGKVTHDANRTSSAGDLCVVSGTELTRVGGVVEIYPFKGNETVRLHAGGNYAFGSADERNTLQDRLAMVDVGLTWRIHLKPFAKRNVTD